MKKILVLGASGQIASHAINQLLEMSDAQLVLFARHPNRVNITDSNREKLIKGNTLNLNDLSSAMEGVDAVYANLAGKDIAKQAQNIVNSMVKANIKQLVWISSIGIYDEVPGKFGEWNHQMLGAPDQPGTYLGTYRQAADIVSSSGLDYTIIRPAWLTNNDEIDYELTKRGEKFKGTEVSRKSIGNLVAKILINPSKFKQTDLGVDKPGSDGDKPQWY